MINHLTINVSISKIISTANIIYNKCILYAQYFSATVSDNNHKLTKQTQVKADEIEKKI